jgi:hypothetical protein
VQPLPKSNAPEGCDYWLAALFLAGLWSFLLAQLTDTARRISELQQMSLLAKLANDETMPRIFRGKCIPGRKNSISAALSFY